MLITNGNKLDIIELTKIKHSVDYKIAEDFSFFIKKSSLARI